MKINNYSLSDEIKLEIGSRFKALRLSMNYSQTYVSEKSGVSLRTIQYFEKEGSITLENLIKLLKVLNIADNLNYLIPETGLNTIDLYKLGHQKQRISRESKTEHKKWGDEQW